MMDPNNSRQFRLSIGSTSGPQASFLARALSLVVGVGVFALAVVVGGALLLVLLALVTALAAVFGIRIWWWKRKMAASMSESAERSAATPGDRKSADSATIDAEYRVIDE